MLLAMTFSAQVSTKAIKALTVKLFIFTKEQSNKFQLSCLYHIYLLSIGRFLTSAIFLFQFMPRHEMTNIMFSDEVLSNSVTGKQL